MFNGGLQAVIGLRDAAALTHSDRAHELFRRGERAARREVAPFDTGAWSLYSERGAESTLSYHELTAGFLAGLCDRVRRGLLPREPALRALRARADADRRRAAAKAALGPHEHRALHALEDLDRQGARVGHARDEPVARPREAPARDATRWPGARRAAGATACGSRPAGRAARVGVEQRTVKVRRRPAARSPAKKKKKKAAPRSPRKGSPRDRDAAAAASRRQPD